MLAILLKITSFSLTCTAEAMATFESWNSIWPGRVALAVRWSACTPVWANAAAFWALTPLPAMMSMRPFAFFTRLVINDFPS